MNKYYCVTTTYDDKGRVTANITSFLYSEEMPRSTYRCTSRRDIYTDWFESLDEAQQFVDEAKNA